MPFVFQINLNITQNSIQQKCQAICFTQYMDLRVSGTNIILNLKKNIHLNIQIPLEKNDHKDQSVNTTLHMNSLKHES